MIVPFPFDEEGLDFRRAEMAQVELSPNITVDYKPLKAGVKHFLGRHDEMLIEFAIWEAGIALAEEGYDAITVNTLSDSGVAELRAVLDIPVVSCGKASFLYALSLGTRFSVIVQTDPAYPMYTDAGLAFYKNLMKKFEVSQFCTSIELFEAPSDVRALFTGREDEVFPKMKFACENGLAKGADVIILGSTTLSQAGPYLSENLPVPVINPGPLALKMVETVLGLGHTHSPIAHPQPAVIRPKMIHAMLDAAREFQDADD
jgi:allantoin racemase